MNILTVQEAAKKGFNTTDYETDIGLKGKVLKLDFRTKGRGDWIDCFFSCARGGADKYRLAAFAQSGGIYSASNCRINFGASNVLGSIFVITTDDTDGITSWSKATKIL